MKADFVMADKGYDSDRFVDAIRDSGASPVIPPRKNRTSPRDYDKVLYKERNLVELAFQKLKHYRRIATRYERVEKHYTAMLSLVSTVIWLA
ncbi:hypothetical protein GCM10011502_27930 [Oceanisphaera marina]|uniref:Transposase DDE domain-containing protein n=1 Tax=Oceanisphaera marina TaxID=2017550 RepID=A0ABQ1IXW3_9GAMM|nr:hypothetical protein GCM10011502_27930 [Oceanisphaera marina]